MKLDNKHSNRAAELLLEIVADGSHPIAERIDAARIVLQAAMVHENITITIPPRPVASSEFPRK